MVFTDKAMRLINYMKEISECGDIDYEQAIKRHVMMYVTFVREKDNKLIIKNQIIGIDPWTYDYYGNIANRMILKEGAIPGSVKVMTLSEYIEIEDNKMLIDSIEYNRRFDD